MKKLLLLIALMWAVKSNAQLAAKPDTLTFTGYDKVINVLENDNLGVCSAISANVRIVTNPTNSPVKVNADKTITYTPNANYLGAIYLLTACGITKRPVMPRCMCCICSLTGWRGAEKTIKIKSVNLLIKFSHFVDGHTATI